MSVFKDEPGSWTSSELVTKVCAGHTGRVGHPKVGAGFQVWSRGKARIDARLQQSWECWEHNSWVRSFISNRNRF